MAVPGVGGAFSGPTEIGALGLAYSPAAALPLRPEIVLDIGVLHSANAFTLKGSETQTSSGTDVVPFLGAAVPLGEIGIGYAFVVPWARSSTLSPTGAHRFHSIEGALTVLEHNVAVAWSPDPVLQVGGALRIDQVSFETQSAYDTGKLIADLTGLQDWIGDPFLEGTRQVTGAQGLATGFAVGVRLSPIEAVMLAAHYRSGINANLSGDFQMIPVTDLNMVIEGDITTEMRFPHDLTLAAEVKLDRFTLVPEIAWVGWSSWATVRSEPGELTLGSSDPVMEALLEGWGLTDAAFLNSDEPNVTHNGTEDVWMPGIGVQLDASEALQVRAGLYYAPNAVPNQAMHPGNQDWPTTNLRLAGLVRPADRVSLGLSLDAYAAPIRTVTNSMFDPSNDMSTGTDLPSGNGEYQLSLMRVGATWVQRF
jgi:long-subunit fatty acid transport protein